MKLIKWLGLLIGLPSVAIALFYLWSSRRTEDPKAYSAIVNYAPAGLNEGEVLDLSGYTLVSYNIGYLSGLANNTATKPDESFFQENQQRAIAALAAVNPDIVAFQEIDFDSQRSYQVNQAEAIAQALKLYNGAIAINWDKRYLPFPYWPISAQFGKILSGQAVLSKSPFFIEKNSRVVLERVAGESFLYRSFYLDRLAQVSEIALFDPLANQRTLIVISVHLEAFDEQTRVNQTKFVRELAEDYAKTNPVIVVGDFNSALNRPDFVSAEGKPYQETQFSIKEMLASKVLTSVVPQSDWNGKNATFPSDKPEYKLDYMFYTPSTIEVLETQVLTAAGESSDHLPLMMRFRLK